MTTFTPPENPCWHPERDGFTQSLLRCFAQDREQFRLKYVVGLQSTAVSLPISFGLLFHRICQPFYTDKYDRKKPPSKTQIHKWIDAYRKKMPVQNGFAPTESIPEKVSAAYGDVCNYGKATIPEYVNYWSSDFTGKKQRSRRVIVPSKWLSVEENFSVPLLSLGRDGLKLRGSFDGVFEDSRGRLWLFETKTKSLINHDELMNELNYDLQVWLYLMALYLQTGRVPYGVLYNVVRRSGLRRRVNEPDATFFGRIEEDIHTRPDDYFFRYEMTGITQKKLLDKFYSLVVPRIEEIMLWWDGKIPHYTNYDALRSKYGKVDMYEMILNGNDLGLKKKDRAFVELDN